MLLIFLLLHLPDEIEQVEPLIATFVNPAKASDAFNHQIMIKKLY